MAKARSELRRSLRGGAAELRDEDVASLCYTKLVVKETLRLHPPLPLLLPRLAREPRPVGGHEIPAGSRVLVNAWAIGRDARRWGDDAEGFRPDRFEEEEKEEEEEKLGGFEYLPFGAGRRMCPGMGFGTATAEAALANLLCFFDWTLPEGTVARDLDMGEAVGAVVGRTSDHSSCRPTVFTCNAVLNALLRRARYADMLSLHRFITQASVAPTVVTYNLLLQAYCDRHKNEVEELQNFISLLYSGLVTTG